MSVRVEWHEAKAVSAEVYPPGNDNWVGAADQGDDYVLCISTDEVAAIYGSAEDLRRIATEIGESVGGGGITITRDQLETWVGHELTDDQVDDIGECVPNSSIPQAIASIALDALNITDPKEDHDG